MPQREIEVLADLMYGVYNYPNNAACIRSFIKQSDQRDEQMELLGNAALTLLVSMGIIRKEARPTGPELLMFLEQAAKKP